MRVDVQVVDLDCADHLKVPLLPILVCRIGRSQLKDAIYVALIDDPDDILLLPPEARCNYFEGLGARVVVPQCIEEVPGEGVVDELISGLFDDEFARVVIEVQEVGEVGREEIRVAGLLCQTGGESVDLVDLLPFDFLTSIPLDGSLLHRSGS